ncbi:MAG: hypothetical protein GXP46_01920 [Deferribacteres bacterium]|nr:hypothetical protein [Deferribacteres bacterium]
MADYFVDSTRGDDTNGTGAWKAALTGTITMTNGSTAVSAVGGAFTSELWAGAWICLDADETSDVWAQVSSITDDNNLVLVSNYTGAGGSGPASKLANWKTVEHADEAGGLAAGDIVWLRRGGSEYPVSDIAPTGDGTGASPIQRIGWPRAAKTLTGNWVNGYPCVWGLSIVANRSEHQTRRIRLDADGKWYMITHIGQELAYDGQSADFVVGETVTGSASGATGVIVYDDDQGTSGTLILQNVQGTFVDNETITSTSGSATANIPSGTVGCFIIDRKFSGTSTSAGASTMQEDDDYSTRPDIGSLRTIWDADGDAPYVIDFAGGAYNIYFNADNYNILKNLEFKDTADGAGHVMFAYSAAGAIIGCLFKTTYSARCIGQTTDYLYLERVTAENDGVTAYYTRDGIGVGAKGVLYAKDVAVYNCGGYGLDVNGGTAILENVNIGVEGANQDADIAIYYSGQVFGRDVQLGGTNGYVEDASYVSPRKLVSIENFQKELGRQKQWFRGGEIHNVDVGDTNAPSVADPTGKTTDLMEILPNVSGFDFIEEWAVDIFTGEEDGVNGARTYTLYIQNNTGNTLNASTAKDDLWLVAEYVSQYSANDAYTVERVFSAETLIAQRADATDWDSLSVTINAAVASKVRLKLYISTYSATGGIYVGGLAVS